ncbi:MAG: hypothetical protein EZS28_040111 [Streblomastix strix]|uniref:HECT-type E3 ubiquitin transferase n=1 Tax=Streblomastix strix TaxID=222440 RepID=A0A5J4U2Z6_9EUKA|nr:MAG: hypothetical protein EZS28_040111 [Streblomastix strix]
MDIITAGEQDIDVNDWEKNTIYEQCSQNSDQQKLWFWEILKEQLNSEQQGSLLQFVTGMRTVPIGGFAHLGPHNSQQQFCIRWQNVPKEAENAVQRSQTPITIIIIITAIVLMIIKTKQIMFQKLILALSANGSFLNG